jgi:carbonic anhydrase
MSAIDSFLRNNAEYAAKCSKRTLPTAPAKKLAIVACMDSRLDPRAVLGLSDGDAHVIRNAGGVVTDDVIRSLTISQHLLGTREIMLIHHTDCGMQTFTDDELKDSIEKETGVRPPFSMGAFADLEDDIRQSIARIKASPFVIHKDAVRGFVYDVGSRRLREVT